MRFENLSQQQHKTQPAQMHNMNAFNDNVSCIYASFISYIFVVQNLCTD